MRFYSVVAVRGTRRRQPAALSSGASAKQGEDNRRVQAATIGPSRRSPPAPWWRRGR